MFKILSILTLFSAFSSLIYALFFHTSTITYSTDFISYELLSNQNRSAGLQNNTLAKSSNISSGIKLDSDTTTKVSRLTENPILESIRSKATPPAIAIAGYNSYLYSNKVKQPHIESILKNHGMKAKFVKTIAPAITKQLRSKAFKRFNVFITATGLSMSIEEYLFPKLSFSHRIIFTIFFVIIVIFLYILAAAKGILK